MEEVKYIPGDLVMTNGVPLGTAKDIVYRVTSSDPSKTLKLDDGTVLKGVVCLENIEGAEFGEKGYLSGDCCAWVKDIAPIPLTPKILKKNGWERNGGDSYLKYSLYRVFFDVCHVYTLKHYEGSTSKYFDFTSKDSKCCYKSNIMYCHQLQHLLFGLGLPMNLKV